MKLYVQRMGQGYPVIILHGLYGSGANWLTIAKNLSGMCEVFLVDQRNHGRSPHAEEHNYQVLSDDLLELMDDLDLPRAVILGHSMGGKAAMWFAAEHPSRVSRLIVADISPRSYHDEVLDAGHSDFHIKVLESMLAVDFNQVSGIGDVDRQLDLLLPEKSMRQFLLKNIEKGADGRYHWRLNVVVLLKNLDNLSSGLESFSKQGRLIDQFPVLFIRGERSRYILEPDIQMIRQLFPQAGIVTIRNAGHWLHAEQPAQFVSILKKQLLG